MATYCPGCNRKLTIADWHQNCPDCGLNLMFHGFEERFFEDAKYAELGNAKVRVWWAKVLTCFFGGKVQIIRLCFILLPIAALLVPMCSLHIELPLFSRDISVGILGAVSAFTDGTVVSAFSLNGASVADGVSDALRGVYIIFAAALLCEVLVIVLQILCFLATRVMSILICIAGALGVVVSLYGIVCVNRLVDAASDYDALFSASSGFGCYAAAAAFIAVFIPNLILAVRNIDVKYREGDLYRVDIAKKLRRGEITLSDLSQPIFETEEERIAREDAIEKTMNGKASGSGNSEGDEL